ncbi:UNVERIFIED_CONTAM: hypothetical protein Slati_4139400 [Sesamum latifolium]|uniref:RNase H type-1 domain-containing protein n=1 Tax=Sesamum latifolium TaxID=2727402 RepID=A0AAW2T875_9LAMI
MQFGRRKYRTNQSFLWRACKEAIPTTSNLIRRKCAVELACMTCGNLTEDSKHALLECPFARQTWALADIPWSVISQWRTNVEDWEQTVMDNSHSSPIEVVASARSFLQDFHNCTSRTNLPGQSSATVWSPPKEGLIKINFDAAVGNESCEAGLGVIARDHEGKCIAWRTDTLEDASAIGPIITDILRLSSFFDTVSYAHVKRSANSAAHCLAKAAFSIQAGDSPSLFV